MKKHMKIRPKSVTSNQKSHSGFKFLNGDFQFVRVSRNIQESKEVKVWPIFRGDDQGQLKELQIYLPDTEYWQKTRIAVTWLS